MKFWQRHPFPVLARFDRVVAVSFAFPESLLRPLLPKQLEIDSNEGLGFVTVALVWTRDLRPAGFPVFMGQDFFLAGYRIFARLRDSSGRRLRGLKILRSETDRHRMVWLGNLMTGYRYRYVNARLEEGSSEKRVRTALPDGTETLRLSWSVPSGEVPLPAGSPFPDWRTARRFAGPMPFTFSAGADDSIIVVEGSRLDWTPRPILLRDWRVALFDEEPFCATKPIVANAFMVDGVSSYRWERGRIMRARATE